MFRLFAIAFLLAWPSIAPAQFSLNTSDARTITTITPTISTQLTTSDGVKIGDPVVTQGDTETPPAKPAKVITISTEWKAADLMIKAESETCQLTRLSDFVFVANTPGEHKVKVELINLVTREWPSRTITIKIDGKPDQDPEVDPDDIEPDDDDEPEPDPNDIQPGSIENLRVLFVFESSELSKLDERKKGVLFSSEIRTWLADNCMTIGSTPEYRFLDQDVEYPENNPSRFRELLKRDRDSLPWLVVEDDARGVAWEGPMPHSTDACLALLKEWKKAPRSAGQLSTSSPRYELVPVQVQVCDGANCYLTTEYQWKLVK